jgi:glyoxylase-like metal-dependent hydrolase (beta-lactamase superfamily II)
MSQVRKISKTSDLPLRVLVVVGHHPDHTGTDAQFAAAAVPIVAQDHVRKNLLAAASFEAATTLPSFTYEHDYTLRMGGVEARLLHFGNACTDGDTVVYFPDLKVVAVGDLFRAAGSPAPDFAAGGSLVHWGNVLEQVLKLDFDTVIASTGTPATRADLEAFKSRIDALVSRATRLVRQGVSKDQLMSRLQTDDLGWHLDLSEAQLAGFYAELTTATE